MSNKYKNIDDLFRDKFENFEPEPPDHIWENIKTKISGNDGGSGKNGLGNGTLIGISVILITIGMLTSFLLVNQPTVGEKAVNIPEITNINPVSDPDFDSAASQDDPVPLEYVERGVKIIKEQIVFQEKSDKKDRKKRSKKYQKGQPAIQPEVTASLSPERSGKTNLLAKPNAIKLTSENSNTFVAGGIVRAESNPSNQLPVEKEINQRADLQDLSTLKNVAPPEKKTLKIGGEWSLGAYFTPEVIRYPSDINLNNYSYSVNLLTSWRKNNFIVQSGLGLTQVKDIGEFEIHYNKYLGSYEDVYDVRFDSVGNEVVPTFFTETVNVYDSISHVNYTHTKRTYTYLQVPLLFGYAHEFKRFGWFVKTGPAISFVVNKKVPKVAPTSDPYRLLAMNSDIPDRISTQWSYMFTAGISYRIGGKMNMSVEPLFRYHIDPAYERNSLLTKHPYSFGLRMGIVYNF